MQRTKKKLYCVLLSLCFIASCICSDDFKTDKRMPLSGAINQSDQIISTGCRIPYEKVCTVEASRNTHTALLNQHTILHTTEIHRKSDTPFSLYGDLRSLKSPFQFYSSANPDIYTDNIDAADIIHFIHDKDGKK